MVRLIGNGVNALAVMIPTIVLLTKSLQKSYALTCTTLVSQLMLTIMSLNFANSVKSVTTNLVKADQNPI